MCVHTSHTCVDLATLGGERNVCFAARNTDTAPRKPPRPREIQQRTREGSHNTQ